MKIQTATDFTASNMPQGQAYTLAKGAHLFSILSKKLYSKPIESVVREVASNAYDAHIQAGLDKPIEVLVNAWDDIFTVEDWGPGISPSDMSTYYTSYGNSSKTEDNSQIGGFGLGCKSPYAYTDDFTVESSYEGVHRTYHMYMVDGVPHMALVREEAAAESSSGVKVTIPLKSSYDADQFTAAINSQLVLFPEGSLKTSADFSKVKVQDNKTHYQVIDESEIGFGSERYRSYGVRRDISLAVGCIPYDLGSFDADRISNCLTSLLNPFINLFYPTGARLYVKLGVGEVPLTPSREAILFNSEVDKIIGVKINKLLSDFLDDIWESNFKDKPKLFDNCKVAPQALRKLSAIVKRYESAETADHTQYDSEALLINKIRDFIEKIEPFSTYNFHYKLPCALVNRTSSSGSKKILKRARKVLAPSGVRNSNPFVLGSGEVLAAAGVEAIYEGEGSAQHLTDIMEHNDHKIILLVSAGEANKAAKALGRPDLPIVVVDKVPKKSKDMTAKTNPSGTIDVTQLIPFSVKKSVTITRNQAKSGDFYWIRTYRDNIVLSTSNDRATWIKAQQLGHISISSGMLKHVGKPVYLLDSKTHWMSKHGEPLVNRLYQELDSMSAQDLAWHLYPPSLESLNYTPASAKSAEQLSLIHQVWDALIYFRGRGEDMVKLDSKRKEVIKYIDDLWSNADDDHLVVQAVKHRGHLKNYGYHREGFDKVVKQRYKEALDKVLTVYKAYKDTIPTEKGDTNV